MSGSARFQTQQQWSLIPGPMVLPRPTNSQEIQDIQSYSVAAVAESFLSYSGLHLLSPAEPSWWEWRGRWESGRDFIEVGMTLFDETAQSWGGSPITADCTADAIEALWSYIQSRHRGVWLHDADCIVHTHDSFRHKVAV
jgi:hypothetical protein